MPNTETPSILHGTCACGRPVVEYPEELDNAPGEPTKSTGFVFTDGSAQCYACDAEAEAAALAPAETGAAREALLDCEYSNRYDD